jgi:hypothetical protein
VEAAKSEYTLFTRGEEAYPVDSGSPRCSVPD